MAVLREVHGCRLIREINRFTKKKKRVEMADIGMVQKNVFERKSFYLYSFFFQKLNPI